MWIQSMDLHPPKKKEKKTTNKNKKNNNNNNNNNTHPHNSKLNRAKFSTC